MEGRIKLDYLQQSGEVKVNLCRGYGEEIGQIRYWRIALLDESRMREYVKCMRLYEERYVH